MPARPVAGTLGLMSKNVTWRWVRRIPAAREDAWRALVEQLGLSPAVHGRPRARLLRLEAYAPKAGELRPLAREHGGKIERIDLDKILASAAAPRRALAITRDLGVVDANGHWPANKPKPRALLRISGAMAFGTGEHATTASCLRVLGSEHLPAAWTMLDIGSGSGILAIAAEKLGAERADAFDHDPRAVRAARDNARRNRCKRVAFSESDILRWKPRRRYTFVAANMFSELLRAAAPRIASAVAPGGTLVISGILRVQEKETVGAFAAEGFVPAATLRRGKWCTVRLRERA